MRPVDDVPCSRVPSFPHSRQFDVVIAGASFAGLAAAQRIRGRVALIDKDPIGEGVTSACGAPVSTVRAMGAEASIKQIHDHLIIHTERSRAVWPLTSTCVLPPMSATPRKSTTCSPGGRSRVS